MYSYMYGLGVYYKIIRKIRNTINAETFLKLVVNNGGKKPKDRDLKDKNHTRTDSHTHTHTHSFRIELGTLLDVGGGKDANLIA